MPALFAAAALVSAFLLFFVQPMLAKMMLPRLGGSPAVWTTCMLWFQAALLAGYAWAHLLTRWFRPAFQLVAQAALLLAAGLLLPLALPAEPLVGPGGSPVILTLGVLTAGAGLPFLALASTAPLLQRWLSRTRGPLAGDPYWLYAASNLGSLAALLVYPTLIEPRISLTGAAGPSQSLLWSGGYLLAAGLTAACGVTAWRRSGGLTGTAPPVAGATSGEPALAASRLFWVALAFVPSSAMLAVTQRLSTDIAPIPLLWVVPLALYLVTWVAAFSRHGTVPPVWSGTAAGVLAVISVMIAWLGGRQPASILMALDLLTLLAIGLLCHVRLALARPPAARLTEFYLWIAAGGALGGLFNGLVAPRLFDSLAEYPIVLALACLLRPGVTAPLRDGARRAALELAPAAAPGLAAILIEAVGNRTGFPAGVIGLSLRFGVPIALCLIAIGRPLRFAAGLAGLMLAVGLDTRSDQTLLHAERTFFGVHRVLRVDAPDGPYHLLSHGSTTHGVQSLDPERRRVPGGYYHRSGPLGEIFRSQETRPATDAIAVIGLGAGTMAAYGAAGRSLTFYEIDPAVARIARDERLFTYLGDCRARLRIVTGDGRLEIARAPDASYGLIVVDAFLSDSVPVHLFTREAIDLYLRKTRPGGLVALHVTNYYLDLEPVIAAIAGDLGLHAMLQHDARPPSREEFIEGKQESTWAVLSRDGETLATLASGGRWKRLGDGRRAPGAPGHLWTDDFSSLFGILRLR